MNLRDIVNPWLIRFGAEPYRFWLLTDLFDELSSRREMWGSLGRSGVTLKVLGSLYAVLMTIMTFGMVSSAPPFFNYSAFLMGFGGFILGMVLISETSTSLVNVEEGTLLAHQPINGATYTLSKLAHILQVLLWLVPMVNGAPALGSLFLKDTHWYSPFTYLGTAALLGFAIALSCCGLFGMLLRIVEPSRVRAVAQTVEMSPLLIEIGRAHV